MAIQGLLAEQAHLCFGLAAQNITGSAVTASWVSFAFNRRNLALIQTGAWAGGTSAVTLNQAKTQAGGSSKALAFNTVYIGTSTSSVLTTTAVVSNTFNLGTASQLWAIEIHAQDLDVVNGFLYYQVALASPGGNNDFVSVTYVAYDVSYAGKPDNLPNALA